MGPPQQIVAAPADRTITATYERGVEQRFAMHAESTGNVYWRCDTFRIPPGGPREWLSTTGPITVADVVDRLPEHRDAIVAWTRREIDLGPEAADDPVSAAGRRDALERLTRELGELDLA